MHSLPTLRIGRQLIIFICCIQVFQLCLLSSYTFRLVFKVQPFSISRNHLSLSSLQLDRFSVTRTSHSTGTVSGSKAYLLIPIDQPDLEFCRCLRTHLINGYQPILVNFGIDAGGDRANKYFKIQGVYNYLKRNPEKIRPHDIVAIIDGFDVYSQLGPDTFVRRFINTGKRILTGAEKSCFPNDPIGPVCTDIPQSEYDPDSFGPETDKDTIDGMRAHTRPRWVNSGTVVGYKEDLDKLYDSMVIWEGPDNDHGSDQRVFAVHYYWGNFSISLDFKSTLFVSVAFAEWELDFQWTKLKELDVDPWKGTLPGKEGHGGKQMIIERKPVVRNRLMKSSPVFVHFPGVAKEYLVEWDKSLWWSVWDANATEVMTEYVLRQKVKIAESGMEYTYREVCKEFITDSGRLVEELKSENSSMAQATSSA